MADDKRRYRAGSRRGRTYRPSPGVMSERRLAFLRTMIGQFNIMRYDEDNTDVEEVEESEDGEQIKRPFREPGLTYKLLIPRVNAKPLLLDLTSLTEKELWLTRQFFNLLFDLAEPVVRERDRVAQDAFDQGDDSYTRVYRQVPQFVVRKGAVRTDSESVLLRSYDILGGNMRSGQSRDGDSADGLRGDGAELVDGSSAEGGSQDDGETAD